MCCAGEWSVKFQYPAMPYDGILLGSRMLVAKEALTSTAVKEYLAARCDGVIWAYMASAYMCSLAFFLITHL